MGRKKKAVQKKRKKEVKMVKKKKKFRIFDFIFFEEGQLGFWRWLPISKSKAMRFKHGQLEFRVYVEPKYSETFIFEPDLAHLYKGNHWVRALKVDVIIPTSIKLEKAIYNMYPPTSLIRKIAHPYRVLINSLCDIVRNDLGQWWITHRQWHPSTSPRDVLGGMHYIDSSGKSRQFLTRAAVNIKSRIPNKNELITKNRWKKIKQLINDQYRVDVAFVCLANAYYYYHRANYRVALIEAVIALERAIFKFVTKHLSKSNITKAKQIFKEQSIYEAAKELLPLVDRRLRIKKKDIDNCCKAIEDRNLVVHRTMFKVNMRKASEYIKSISVIVKKLVPKKFR